MSLSNHCSECVIQVPQPSALLSWIPAGLFFNPHPRVPNYSNQSNYWSLPGYESICSMYSWRHLALSQIQLMHSWHQLARSEDQITAPFIFLKWVKVFFLHPFCPKLMFLLDKFETSCGRKRKEPKKVVRLSVKPLSAAWTIRSEIEITVFSSVLHSKIA